MKKLYLLLFLCLAIINLGVLTQQVMAFGEGCGVYITVVQSIPSVTWTPITFGGERWDDSLQCHAASANTMFVAEGYAGYYMISGFAGWSSPPAQQFCAVVRNGSQHLVSSMLTSAVSWYCDLSTVYYLAEGDYVQFQVNQYSGGGALNVTSSEFRMVRLGPGSHPAFNSIQGIPGVASTPQSPQDHASSHQDAGSDEINVAGLSGILTDTQDAAWFQGLAITTTGVADGQVLAWNMVAEEWQPTTVSGTGGLMDMITATISGTVPVIITNTYQFTEALSSGHDMAIIRSFTYGEASIAIGLFVVAAILGVQLLFALRRR